MPGFFKRHVEIYDCGDAAQRSDNRFDRLVQTEIEKVDVAELLANQQEEDNSVQSEE